MSREELLSKLENFTNTSRLADFILENFVEKPKPTAIQKFAKMLERMDYGQANRLAAELLQYRAKELKEFISEFEREAETRTQF